MNILLVSGCIPNTQKLSVPFLLDIRFHIPRRSPYKHSSIGLVHLIGNLIANEETNDIIILLERVDDSSIPLVLRDRPVRRVGFDRNSGGRQIGYDIDACIG